ncbi:MAG TPA: MEDS domain-containing protein [Solirubrobacteraceae bacterium]|nr:MEDS domain-containing protein [Solirubrobacteraceae bacterium]
MNRADALEPHDHVAWYGDGAEDLYALGSVALAAGARRNEKLMFVAKQPDAGLLSGLGDAGRLLESGQLEVADVDEVYGSSGVFSPDDQLATFEGVLSKALADGYAGIRVVADNTPLASGDENRFRRWLAWEQITDRFQSRSNVTGICYFDRRQMSEDRLSDLASLHPVCAVGSVEPPFSFFIDGDAVAVTGALDAWSAEQFRRILDTAPDEEALVLDLSETEFVDHRALLALNAVASAQRPVRIRHAPSILRRMPSLLAIPTPHLSFD